MKYILPLILLLVLGCQKNEKEIKDINTTIKQETKSSQKTKSDNIIIIKLNNLTITFKDNLLVYPKKRIFLLFDNNSSYSKMQENVLKNLNVTYIKTNNQYLKNYFQIQKYPSIIILDKNKTVKFENFVPYEILKAEGY